jgi:hypothetical protein
VYHYEGEEGAQKFVDKDPEIKVLDDWIELTRKYWQTEKRNVAPGCFNFPTSSYEVATREDFEIHIKWFKEHKDEWPNEEVQGS